MKKVFLVILNWNGGEVTLNCLQSVSGLKKGGLSLEVVVVDNASIDQSVEKIQKNFPKVRLVRNEVNLGFAEGNNVGLRLALKEGADFVCVLNNDTRVAPDFMKELVKVAETKKEIGIVGGKIYFEKGFEFHKEQYQKKDRGRVIWYAGAKMDWQNVYAHHRGVDEVDKGQYDQPEETEYVTGCLMLIKRAVLEKVGFFDPQYFLYFEENDFCQRAKKAGFKLYYAPAAEIWHLNASSSGTGSSLHDYYLTRNRLLFGFRWAPWRAKLALLRESGRLLWQGRKWQRIGVRDFYLRKLGKGSWF